MLCLSVTARIIVLSIAGDFSYAATASTLVGLLITVIKECRRVASHWSGVRGGR